MSDQEQFQSGERQNQLEIVNVSAHSGWSLPVRKIDRQNNYQWRFEKIKRVGPLNNSPRKIDTKNISFQTQQLIQLSESEKDSDEQSRYSAFTSQYSKCEQMYKKKILAGTRWLGKKQYFASIFIDPAILSNFDLMQIFKPQVQESSTSKKQCAFNSNFESGNLLAAYQISKNQYDLILQNDVNTKGNTQWFYFQIKNMPAKTKIKINIVNMLKSDSLFNYGMQPCVFSSQANKYNNQGWVRSGNLIKYFRNQSKVDGSNRYYYTLTFTVSTSYEGDNLKIAQCYPYTLTDYQTFIENAEKRPGVKAFLRRQSAGSTIGKNDIEVLHIRAQNPRKKQDRKIIFVTARQHPGETPGSYVCQGFINYVISDQKQAIYLRKNYEIIIFPMLNPDGVVVGNYRTNICGLDLNRRWDGSKAKQAQQANFVKRYISDIAKGRQVSFLIDLHGHSRKLFSFFYGNSSIQNPIQVRMFPYVCSKLSQNHVRFEDSTFVYEQAKRKTARIQLGLKLKILNIFTFQTSFFGFINKKKQKVHFTIAHFKQLGALISKSLYICERSKTNPESVEALMIKKFQDQLKNKPQLIARGNQAGSGSESEPEKGEIVDLQYDKLLNSEQFSKQISDKKKKSLKKRDKKQIFIKEITKASRQMHVMDIARVNSVFPNDALALALMPSSYGKKNKQKSPEKKFKENVAVQTQEIPIIKIYDMCKVQERKEDSKQRFIGMKNSSESNSPNKSNLFRTIIRPRSSSNAYLDVNLHSGKRQIRQRHQSGVTIKSKEQLKQIKSVSSQTFMTFPPNSDFLNKTLDCLIVNPISKVQLLKKKSLYSTISTTNNISDLQQNKRSSQSFKIGLKALNVETWRIKKKSFQ